MNGKRKGVGVFIASACVSLLILGGFLLLFMVYVKTAQAEAIRHDVTAEDRYHPEQSESLGLIVIGCDQAEDLPGLVQLIYYDAPAGTVFVVGISPAAVCTLNSREDTLAGHYDYEGIRGTVNGVSKIIGFDADRYLRIQRKGISNLVDYLGGIPYDLPEPRMADGYEILPGPQLFDGRRTAALLFSGGNPDTEFQADLTFGLIQNGLNEKLGEKYDSFVQAVFFNSESNLNQYDFVSRKRGLTGMLETGTLTVRKLTLSGTYSDDETKFYPDPESAASIAAELSGGISDSM